MKITTLQDTSNIWIKIFPFKNSHSIPIIVSVHKHAGHSSWNNPTINWPSYGENTLPEAKEFSAAMAKAVEILDYMEKVKNFDAFNPEIFR
jgi:hypothetical protein